MSRTCLALYLLAFCFGAEAHIGSPNVFFEGKAGEYPVRVVIRPPQVVPGLAEISVRVPGEPVQRVTVLPVFSKAGREGAPPPDEARLVRDETNLYSAALWLMKPGAYSVDVTIEGARGQGTLVLPVNSMATNTRPMTRGYGLMLSALAIVLFVGALRIAGAIFGESRLEPGARPGKTGGVAAAPRRWLEGPLLCWFLGARNGGTLKTPTIATMPSTSRSPYRPWHVRNATSTF